MADFVGTSGDDVLNGTLGDDTFFASDGNDNINGGDGIDTVDYSSLTLGILSQFGGSFLGSFTGTLNKNTGRDTLSGIERIIATDHDDTVVVPDIASHMYTADLFLDGRAGNDFLATGWGNDEVLGGEGDDFIKVGAGTDTVDGGAGQDRVSYFYTNALAAMNQALFADLRTGIVSNDGYGFVDTLINIEELSGGSTLADTFHGNDDNNILAGNVGGADSIYGHGGDDTIAIAEAGGVLEGGEGSDTLLVLGERWVDTGFLDYVRETASVTINLATQTFTDGFGGTGSFIEFENALGGLGDDTITGDDNDNVIQGYRGADTMFGGLGFDTLSYEYSEGGVTARFDTLEFSGGHAEGDTATGFEAITGSTFSDVLYGDSTENTLLGLSGNDTINGGGGNDTIDGGDGDDTLNGGDGDDTFIGSLGNDTIYGGTGVDRIDYSEQDYSLNAIFGETNSGALDTITYSVAKNLRAGPDNGTQLIEIFFSIEQVIGTRFDDTVAILSSASASFTSNLYFDGGAGDDILWSGDGNDTVLGGDGSDRISSRGGNDVLNGGAGDDRIFAGDGDDILNGGQGDDTLDGGSGADVLDGGDGDNWLYYFDTLVSSIPLQAIIVDMRSGITSNDGFGFSDSFSNFSSVLGGSLLADTFYGDDNDNRLAGSIAGSDNLYGFGGNDRLVVMELGGVLDGGDGQDTLEIASARYEDIGDDRLVLIDGTMGAVINLVTGTGSDTFGNSGTFSNFENARGSLFDDIITGDDNDNIIQGSGGADTMIGGLGFDTLSYEFSDAGVTARLDTLEFAGGHAEGDTATGFEAISGSSHRDIIFGNDGDNLLSGLSGDDSLTGYGGDDQIFGNEGDDTISGGAGADSMDGGAGFDFLSYAAAESGVQVYMNLGLGFLGDAEGDEFSEFEGVYGSQFDDIISAGNAPNGELYNGLYNYVVEGKGGNDFIRGGDLNDFLAGEIGNDALFGNDGSDWLNGGVGDDRLYGGSGNDTLLGDVGNDLFWGEAGNDTIVGSAGQDILMYSQGTFAEFPQQPVVVDLRSGVVSNDGYGFVDTVSGIYGIYGGSFGADTFHGDNSANYIFGQTGGADTIFGYEGDDLIGVAELGGVIDGGNGSDTFFLSDIRYAVENPEATPFEYGTGVTINLLLSNAIDGFGARGVITNFENAIGTRFDDRLIGNSGDSTLSGGSGDDVLLGDAGDDVLNGGAANDVAYGGIGNDTLNGDAGNDRLIGNDGDDIFDGGTGDDRIIGGAGVDTGTGGDGADTISGGAGNDILNGGEGNDLMRGDDGDDTLDGEAGDDYVVGGIGNDTLNGDGGNDRINGGLQVDTIDGGDGDDILSGNGSGDTITGGAGNDRVQGDGGNDMLFGGTGEDTMYGGDGVDTIHGGDDIDTILGGGGSDIINGDAGNDILRGEGGNDTVNGGLGDDNIRGQDGFDTLNGGDGNDRIQGDGGIDTIDGGAGNDIIFGGDTNDRITGGADADILNGNGGIDTFYFNAGDSLIGAEDRINGFEAVDRLWIDGHTFVGEAAFSGTGAFEVRYSSTAGDTVIELDRDGDGTADEAIDINSTAEWDFTSNGTIITGIVVSPSEGELI